MSGAQLYSVRGARLVAAGRAVLAAFLLVSVTLGALEEGDHGALVRLLLGLYLVYGLALLLTLRSRMASHWLTVAPYAPACVDLAVFTALLYLTKGADSPFFSPLLFLVLSATVQWGSRGALAMGAAAVAAFIPAALGALGDGDRAALTTVVRLGTVTVVIGLLTAFARHQERVVEELARLSDPMNDAAHDADPPVREGLAHALNVFRARRGVFLWAEDDEPYVRAVQTDGDGFTERWAPPTEDEWLVHPELAASVFLYDRNTGRTVSRLGGFARLGASPLSATVTGATSFDHALVIPVHAEPISGWIMVLDHEEQASEDLAVGAMVGAQVSVGLGRWQAQRVRRESAASEERMRMARDLHDGVLQFLAGASLQLEAMLRSGQLPDAAQARLATLRVALGDEQRELRGFISAMRPRRPDEASIMVRLDEELGALAQRLSRHWSTHVSAEVTPRTLTVTERTAYDIGRIVREAVANAVRHGQAAHVSITTLGTEGGLTVQIDDDGQGFGFAGLHSDEELAALGVGPRSLQERVRALQGRLTVESSPEGASVTIEVPIAEMA